MRRIQAHEGGSLGDVVSRLLAKGLSQRPATGAASQNLRWTARAMQARVDLDDKEAMDNLRSLLSLPRVRAIAERDGFLEEYAAVTRNLSVRGNLVPDAHLATVLRQHGVRTLYTNDADFKKFDFLSGRGRSQHGRATRSSGADARREEESMRCHR